MGNTSQAHSSLLNDDDSCSSSPSGTTAAAQTAGFGLSALFGFFGKSFA